MSIAPVAGVDTFAFLSSAPLEPASLDVVDEWLVAQDEGAGQETTPAKPDSDLRLFLGEEWPAEERKRNTAAPRQTRTPDDALQLWFGDAEPPPGDVDRSEKKADTLLDKQTPVSRLVH